MYKKTDKCTEIETGR